MSCGIEVESCRISRAIDGASTEYCKFIIGIITFCNYLLELNTTPFARSRSKKIRSPIKSVSSWNKRLNRRTGQVNPASKIRLRGETLHFIPIHIHSLRVLSQQRSGKPFVDEKV